MARVDGKNLSLAFGAVEVACVSTSILLDNEKLDAEVVTFDDITKGNDRRWFFTITGLPDLGPGTWWSLLWNTPANTSIPFRYAPYGNTTASPEQPHFTGAATVDQKPPVGGEAGQLWKFDTRLTCTAPPTRVTA